MSGDSKDLQYSRHWAIASIGSAGFLWSESFFDLVNLDNGRAHGAIMSHGGLSASTKVNVPGTASLVSSYTEFRTRKPVNFETFDWAGASTSGVGIATPLGGLSYAILSLWDGPAFGPSPIAEIHIFDSSIGLGGSITIISNGWFNVVFGGSGKPLGDPPLHLIIEDKVGPSEPPKPRYRSSPQEAPLMIAGDVLFDFDRASVKPSAAQSLAQVAAIIAKRPPRKVRIEGHTDSIGGYEYNLRLSLRRASAVRDWMMRNGVPGAQAFEPIGYGFNYPIAPNKTAADRAKNRRVEFVFY